MNGLLNTFENIISREDVHNFEKFAKEFGQPVDLPVRHFFSKGVYARELFIPAGMIVVGKIHKHENLNILSQGTIEVLIDDEIQTISAPFTIVSQPGTKRIARALTDVIWTTVHGTDETDLEKIEQKFIAQSELEYLEFVGHKTLPLEGLAHVTV